MTKKKRLHRSPEQKAAILKRHHVDKVPVSTLCEELGLQPSVFYQWQRELFARAPEMLGRSSSGRRGGREADLERKVAALEAKLAKKDSVIAEISQESNGKIERWHKTLKSAAVRPAAPQSREEAERIVAAFVEHYNAVRLHSAIGYVTPNDFLAGRQEVILEERDRKLAVARELRARRRQEARSAA